MDGRDLCFTAVCVRLSGQVSLLLGWTPDQFWAATPSEVATIFAVLSPPGAPPPTADDLKRLQEQFPDR